MGHDLKKLVVVGHPSLCTVSHSQTNFNMMCLLSLHYGSNTAEHWPPHFLFLKRSGMGQDPVGFKPGKNCLPLGKQLSGWPGSELDSLFLVTWFRTWLLHSPYILLNLFMLFVLEAGIESFMYMKSLQALLLALVGPLSCMNTLWALSPFNLQHVNTSSQLYRKYCNLKTDAWCR